MASIPRINDVQDDPGILIENSYGDVVISEGRKYSKVTDLIAVTAFILVVLERINELMINYWIFSYLHSIKDEFILLIS